MNIHSIHLYSIVRDYRLYIKMDVMTAPKRN